MAKSKINLKLAQQSQKNYEERISKNKKGGNFIIPPKTDKSIQEANDVIFNGRGKKYFSKMGNMKYK